VADLRAAGFDDEVEKVGTAVANYLDDGVGGNVAVVSEPYAGREGLLAYAQSLLDNEARWVALDPDAADGRGPAFPDQAADTGDESGESGQGDAGPDAAAADKDGATAPAGALIVADCHHLFERRIDGFAALDAFCDRIALSDALVVTAWNRYAWSYLDAVRDVGETFTTTVEIPALDAAEIRTVVEHHYDERPDVVDDGSAGRVKTVVFDEASVPLPAGRSVGVPYPKPNPAWTASWSVSGAEESVEAVVFEKLRRVSNGNPGVALAVWEASVRDGEIAPAYVEAFGTDPGLDDDAAAVLWSVLAAERVGVDRLTALFPERPVEVTLQNLAERGLVTVADGTVAVAPRALHLVVASLERRGMIW